MSNTWITLETGEVQVMSAGSGLMHSERNNSATEELNLFQIWVIPDQTGVAPAYDQKRFDPAGRKNKLQTLVSSYRDAGENRLQIHQDAQISRTDLDKGQRLAYQLRSSGHGVYIMSISGKVRLNDIELNKRDALGVWQTEQFELKAVEDAEILFIEVPMFF
jgi:redox-sensitive bicupin YhaK (pirin superfamily)